MRDLLKKDTAWNWIEEHKKILEIIKSLISHNSLLVHFKQKKKCKYSAMRPKMLLHEVYYNQINQCGLLRDL